MSRQGGKFGAVGWQKTASFHAGYGGLLVGFLLIFQIAYLKKLAFSDNLSLVLATCSAVGHLVVYLTGLSFLVVLILPTVARSRMTAALAGIGTFFGLLYAYEFWLFDWQDVHLHYFFRIIKKQGWDTFIGLMQQTGFSATYFMVMGGAFFILPGGAIFLGGRLRMGSRLLIPVNLKTLLIILFAGMFIVFGEQLISITYKDQRTWRAEQQTFPYYIIFFRPARSSHFLTGGYQITRPHGGQRKVPDAYVKAANQPRPQFIFLFILETWRQDGFSPLYMPHLSQLGNRFLTGARTVAAANGTHYSWYGILRGQVPFLFHQQVKQEKVTGSWPLHQLKKMGYQIELFNAASLDHYGTGRLLFGEHYRLTDYRFQPSPEIPVEQRDRKVMAQLLTRLDLASQSPTPRMFIIFLDSTHMTFHWDDNWLPAKFKPFLPAEHVASVLFSNNVQRLKNRYWNSVHYVDALLNLCWSKLKQLRLFDSSVIMLTGDHGEEFFENGKFGHAGSIAQQVAQVPILMQFPRYAGRVLPGYVSHYDIMPSLLDYLGLDTAMRNSPLFGKSMINQVKGQDYALLTGVYGADAPYTYVLMDWHMKVRLEFDRQEPFKGNKIFLVDAFTWQDRLFLPGDWRGLTPQNLFFQRFHPYFPQLHFFRFVPQ